MAAMPQNSYQHWDIFCRVIDNFGDIGVCWRLARQLRSEHGLEVRLWVDELPALQAICPEADVTLPLQTCQGVVIHHWTDNFAVDCPGEVIIEAFACELPPSYLAAMASAPQKPVWVNLDYLSAETWAEEWHGLTSPHPSLPLKKYFFFPGFSERSGGLLRENSLLSQCDTEYPAKSDEPLTISLFCYDTAPVGELLAALAASPHASICYVPPGKPLAAVRRHLAGDGPWQHGNARIEPLPFLAQDDYDRLLWRCDINFVRGEDSFVRAQWAGKPFVWQIYRQEEDAHLLKLAAFLDRCCAADDPATRAWRQMFEAWNSSQELGPAWTAFLAQNLEIRRLSLAWREKLAALPDLATALVNFCAGKV